MRYKMICIDMDGTLLNRRKKISDVNKKAIKEAHDMGVEIVVTTGRLYNNAAYYSQLLGVNSPVIAANGAIVIDQKTNDIIYECPIPIEECNKIFKILSKYRVLFQFNTNNTIYCNNWLSKISTEFYMTKQVYFEHLNIEYENVQSKERWKDIFKKEEGYMAKCIVISAAKSTMMSIRNEINKIPNIVSFASGSHSLEINYKNVSKGNAIKALIEKYEIDIKDVICIGDNENDISMIKMAGLGVAMGNAIPEVKKVADYITDTNENDGVAKVINKFILCNKEI